MVSLASDAFYHCETRWGRGCHLPLHPSPPLWIPAFAGMTIGGGGYDEGGGRPAVRGWWLDGVLPHSLAAPLDSGLRRNDELRRLRV